MITEKEADEFITEVIERQVGLMSKSATDGLTADEIAERDMGYKFLRESSYLTRYEIWAFKNSWRTKHED